MSFIEYYYCIELHYSQTPPPSKNNEKYSVFRWIQSLTMLCVLPACVAIADVASVRTLFSIVVFCAIITEIPRFLKSVAFISIFPIYCEQVRVSVTLMDCALTVIDPSPTESTESSARRLLRMVHTSHNLIPKMSLISFECLIFIRHKGEEFGNGKRRREKLRYHYHRVIIELLNAVYNRLCWLESSKRLPEHENSWIFFLCC